MSQMQRSTYNSWPAKIGKSELANLDSLNNLNIDRSTAVLQTRNWIEKVVIGCNFCPFAARELKLDSIRYQVSETIDVPVLLEQLIEECRLLDQQAEVETTLLILTNLPGSFQDYLKYLNLAEQLLLKEGYEGIYQLASFHPEYCFAGASFEEASNFTNRSPYPMFHLLREESLTKALEHHPNPEEIPVRNIAYANELGYDYFKNLWDSCF